MSEAQQTSDYPGALDSWITLTDKEDLAEVSDINKIKAALLAIQTELGTDVAGSLANLITRLAVLMEDNGAINQGTSFPGTPVEGQLFYRTDTDTVYIYDGSTWDTMATPAMTVSSVTSWSGAATSGNITLAASKVYKFTFRLSIDGTTDSAITIAFDGDSAATGHVYSIDGYEETTGEVDAAAAGAANIPLITIEANNEQNRVLIGEFMIFTTANGNGRAWFVGSITAMASSGKWRTSTVGGRFYSTDAISTFSIDSAQNMSGSAYLYEMGLTV